MKSVRYSRYTGDDFGISAEDLMKALSDFFLQSGFDNPYMQFSEFNSNTLEDLKRAIEQALERGEMFDPERAQQIREQLESMSQEQLDQLLGKLVQKLVDEGYITTEQQGGGRGKGEAKVDIKGTDKSSSNFRASAASRILRDAPTLLRKAATITSVSKT